MLEKEVNLIFVSRLSPDGVISPLVCAFDCEYSLLCKGDCAACPPVKNKLEEIVRHQPRSVLEVIGIGSYDLLSGIVGQIESTALETNYLLRKN